MALPVYRLRRWLAAIAMVFTAIVAGMYFYARSRERSVLKQIPEKIGLNISQTANGFKLSKSEGGRTIFTVEASNVTEFKLNGRAELRKVSIVVFGKDSSRYDRISGDDFSYDQKTGNIVANGEVQIDLDANPSGQTGPDQAAPRELKNPIHLKTSDLSFNRDTGVATTDARVEFRTAEATGWALGARYNGHNNNLVLPSRVHISMSERHSELEASSAVVTNDPHVIVMQGPVLQQPTGILRSREATLFLGPTNNVERVLAKGDVQADTREGQKGKRDAESQRNSENVGKDESAIHARSDTGELFLTGQQNQLQRAILTGNVRVDRVGSETMQGTAGRAVLTFSTDNQLDKVRAEEGVHLIQHAAAGSPQSAQQTGAVAQNFDIESPIIDFFVRNGRTLDRAVTAGAARITIRPSDAAVTPVKAGSATNAGQETVITAGKFDAHFQPMPDGKSRLASVHGEPDAKIVSTAPDQPDRISTSQTIDAVFLPQGGIESLTQQGAVAYTDTDVPEKRTQAWADRARYTPADQILTLTGNPRVVSGSMATTSRTVRINRGTGDSFAEGDVKTTYSDVKEQPNGALLASSSPIHVTAMSMTAHNAPSQATYTGKARLWQDANVIEAPTILFDRERRFVLAKGTAAQPVSTIVVQLSQGESGGSTNGSLGKDGSAKPHGKGTEAGQSPIAITGLQLTYSDAERKAHYEGGVTAKGATFTETSKTLDAYLSPRAGAEPGKANQTLLGPSQLDHMVAEGSVVVVQPNRRAVGDKLVYTAADDKFVLTGGPPSIFDAERGKITGVSLTFFRRDDRVLVEGEASSPVVTQMQVAH